MKKTAIGIAAATVALLASAICAATPAVSPAAGTDVVLGLHTEAEGQWQLQFRKETPGQPTETVSVGIAPAYHSIARDSDTRVYDYRLRRIYVIRPDHHFINNSLFADVWFRVAEVENRAVLNAAIEKAGVEAKSKNTGNDPFWAQTELGMLSAKYPHLEIKRTEEGGRTRWLLAGDEVVAVRYGKQPIPDAVKHNVRRVWPTLIPMHPQIVDEIDMSGRMPEELWVKTWQFGKDPLVAHWTLTHAKWQAKVAFPLPPHLSAEAVQPDGAFPEVFAALAANVADKKMPPTQDEYTTRAQNAIKNGSGLEAMLWGVEMSLATGVRERPCADGDQRPFCSVIAQAKPLAQGDSRSPLAFTQKQSPDASDRAQFDNLPNAYFLKLLWASRPPGKGVNAVDTERDLLAALRTSAVANFSKDTGDFYIRSWKPFEGWQVYDLGRFMAGHVAGDLLSDIDALEARLAIDKSEFF